MKRFFLTASITLTLSLAATAIAQDLDFKAYKKFLMSGSQGPKKMAIQTTCTTDAGKTHRIGEKEYDQCLKDVKAKLEKKQLEHKPKEQ